MGASGASRSSVRLAGAQPCQGPAASERLAVAASERLAVAARQGPAVSEAGAAAMPCLCRAPTVASGVACPMYASR